MNELRKAEVRFVKAHSTVVNSFNPTNDQWAEFDAASAELIVLQLAEKPLLNGRDQEASHGQ